MLLRGSGWDHSCGMLCMTISYAWTYLLERPSSASWITHLCVLLMTSGPWSWGSMRVCGGQSVGWTLEALKWQLKRLRFRWLRIGNTWGTRGLYSVTMEAAWSRSIKYLGVQLDRRLSFDEHLQIATNKAIQCGANLAWLMPNIGGLRALFDYSIIQEPRRSFYYYLFKLKLYRNYFFIKRNQFGGHPKQNGWVQNSSSHTHYIINRYAYNT